MGDIPKENKRNNFQGFLVFFCELIWVSLVVFPPLFKRDGNRAIPNKIRQ
jgi:hypothetical protein